MSDGLDPLHADVDPDVLQASAYVDGDLAADERARVEASASIMERVTQIRAARAALASPSPIDPARREQAIAAAIAAFGGTRPADADADADAADPPVAPVVEPRRRTRWLPALAAAAVATLVGVGVVRMTSGSGDDTASDAAIPEATSSAAGSIEAATEMQQGDGDPVPAAAGAEDSSVMADEQRTSEALDINGPGEVGSDGTASPAQPGDASATTSAAPPELVTEADLQDFARARQAQPPAGSPTGSLATAGPCGYAPSDVLGDATHRGAPSVVVVDGDDVIAVDPVTCAEQLRADAP